MGMIRKATSVSTMGLVDFRSDRERTARSARKTFKEARKQTRIMQQMSAPAPVVHVAQAPPVPAQPKVPRKTWTETLTEHPEREMRWWIIWFAIMIFSAVATPYSLLISAPVGVYLFLCRQQAAKARALAERVPFDAQAAAEEARAFGFDDTVFDTETKGRHAK